MLKYLLVVIIVRRIGNSRKVNLTNSNQKQKTYIVEYTVDDDDHENVKENVKVKG